MGKIELIKQAITNAANTKSKLTDMPLAVGGFTSLRLRHLLNNLGSFATNSLEIGSHIGASGISTIFGNDNLNKSYMVDLFSEFNNDGRTRYELRHNLETNIPGKYVFIEKDGFKLTKEDIPEPIDFYLYDATHDRQSQHDGVTSLVHLMADEFILCVDDFFWEDPKRGTYDGIKDAGLTILYEQVLWDGIEAGQWWNGYGIFLLKK